MEHWQVVIITIGCVSGVIGFFLTINVKLLGMMLGKHYTKIDCDAKHETIIKRQEYGEHKDVCSRTFERIDHSMDSLRHDAKEQFDKLYNSMEALSNRVMELIIKGNK